MLLGPLELAVLQNKQVRIMTTNIHNQSTLSKLSDLLFVRQTPAVAAETHKSAAAWFADWRRSRKAAAELSNLSDRDLADIGLTRQEIPAVVARGRK
jgi:uncharacterized protein YjiS (DUF1127 family)